MDDCYLAISHVLTNEAARLNIDINKAGFFGVSAGKDFYSQTWIFLK
jgi:hypothetical protein